MFSLPSKEFFMSGFFQKRKQAIFNLIFILSLFSSVSLIFAGSWALNTITPDGADTTPPPLAVKYYTNVTGPFPSNDWWPSLLVYAFGEGGNRLISLPIEYQYVKEANNRFGLGLYYFDSWGTGYVDNIQYGHGTDLFLRSTNMKTTNGLFQKVSGWGDWNVRSVFGKDNQKHVEVTMTKGSPFLYANFKDNKSPFIYFNSTTFAFFDDNYNLMLTNAGSSFTGDHVGVRLKNGKIYGLFAPPGTVFSNINSKEMQIKLGGTNRYLSMAIMPAVQDLALYYSHAYAFITNTEVTWQYDALGQNVETTYNYYVNLKRPGFSSDPLVVLLPHQWKYYSGAYTGHEYYSPRGKLKAITAASYRTVMPYNGILRDFPIANSNFSPTYSQATQLRYLSRFSNTMGTNPPFVGDTYWQGKTIINMAQAIMIADKLGAPGLRFKHQFMTNLRRVLSDWFTYTPGETRYYFTYWDANTARSNAWGSLIGYKTSYGSENLTDHHYHYGYFIYAASVMATFDTNFRNQHANIIEMIIRDVNSPDRTDPLFPKLRSFDPYEGHCWAGGKSDGWAGNNQESTSESMNAWTGIYLWGLATGQNKYRDLGIYGYTTERNAEMQYWYDEDKINWNAPGYTRNSVGILWGAGQSFATFFGTNPEYVYGIHWLPVHPGLMYLGYNQPLARSLYEGMCDVITTHNTNGNTNEQGWYNIIWAFQALFDPQAALAKWNQPMVGNSESDYIYNYIHNLNAMGAPVTDVRAINWSSYQVFRRNGTNTYVAYNPTSATQVVRFAGDATGALGGLKVPPGKVIASRLLPEPMTDSISNFQVNHDGLANIFIPEKVVIKAKSIYGTIMPSYNGLVTLLVTGAGPVSWTTNGCSTKGVLTTLGLNKATYQFSAADRGIVTLKITDSTVESLKIRVRTTTRKTNVPVYPQFLNFRPTSALSYFKVEHDGLAEITRPDRIIVKAMDANNELIKSWTGLVSLYVAPGTNSAISWYQNSSGNLGVLQNYSRGRATYTFVEADAGVVTLMIGSTKKGKVDPEAKSLSGIADNDANPILLTFKDIGWNIFVDKKNTLGPWDGKYWTSAYKTIQDAVGDYSDGAENNIIIGAGVYNEYVKIDNVSGTKEKPLSIKGYTNGVVITSHGKTGVTLGTNTGNIPNMLMLGTCRYTTIENITFTGASNAGLFLWYGFADSVLRKLTFFKNGGAGLSSIAWNNRNLIENCIAISNGGSGILFDGGAFANYIRNCVVAYNAGGGINTDASNRIDYNNVYGQGAPYQRDASIYKGPYNISEDAQFISQTVGDPDFMKIPKTSPCIDKGDPANDVDVGVYGLHIDMGAFEYNPYPLYIKLNNPNGGETYSATMNYNVWWSNNGNSSKVKLELYRGPLLSMVIATNISTGLIQGSYNWAVPNTIPYATNYRILITDESNTWLMGRSASYFTITNDKFYWVDYPNTKMKYLSGTTITNRWRSTNVSKLSRLDIYKGDLIYYSTIIEQTTNDGSHVWTIPITFGYATNYRLRVSDYSNRLIYDQSDLSFTITNSITVGSNLIYVDKLQRKGPWNGHSWDTAYTNIQAGLSNLRGGNDRRVLVRPAVYRERVRFDETFYSGNSNVFNYLIGVTNGVIIDAGGIYDYPLYISGSDFIKVSNITLLNGTSHGVYFFVTEGNRLERIVAAKNGGSGAMFQGAQDNILINCTFWSNGASGVYNAVALDQTNYFTNCIMQQNNGNGINGGAQHLLDYNNVWGNGADNYSADIIQGINDISQDSLFDVTSRYSPAFLTLRQDSPCRDIGKPTTPVPPLGGVRVDIGAKEGGPLICPIVSINNFTPTCVGSLADLGSQGDVVTINGSGFKDSRGTGSVYFGTLKASNYIAWSNTGIAVRVPKSFANSRIMVSNSCGLSAISSSTLKLAQPVITGFYPASGNPGATMTIYGYGFGNIQGIGQVLFKNTPALVSSWSTNQISVIVPTISGTNRIIVENQFGRSAASSPYPATNYADDGALSWASSGTPSLAFNEGDGSRWESDFSDPQWIAIDLGAVKYINAVSFYWQNAKSSRHLIQFSTNTNMGWTLWKSNINTLEGDYSVTNRGVTKPARYIRMYGYDRVGVWGHSIWEMNMFRSYASTINSNFIVLTNSSLPPHIENLTAFYTNNGSGKVIIRYSGRDPYSHACTYTSAQYSTNGTTWNNMTSNRSDVRHSPQPLAFKVMGTNFGFVWNSTNDLGRTANPTVWVRLRVNNGLSNSTMKTSAPFFIDSARPSIPTLVSPASGVYLTSSQPFYWNKSVDPVGGVSNYRVVLSSNNFVSTQRSYTTVSGLITNWNIFPALGVGPWKWKVRAIDMNKNIGFWSVVSSNTIDVTASSIPQLVSPYSNDTVGSTTIQLKWIRPVDDESGITGYLVEIDNIGFTFGSIIKTTNVIGQNVTNISINAGAGGQKFWRVRAINGAGYLSSYQAWSFNLDLSSPAAPRLISLISNATISNRTPSFTWRRAASSDVTNYRIDISSNFSFVNRRSNWTLTTNYTSPAPLTEGFWYWRVLSKNKTGNISSFTSVWNFRIDRTGPVRPSLIRPVSGKWTNDNVRFFWNKVTNVTGISSYEIHVSSNTAFLPLNTQKITNSTNFIRPLILGDANWYWRVRAYDGLGNVGAWSMTNMVRIDRTPPSINLSTPANGTFTANLTNDFTWIGSDGGANSSGVSNCLFLLDIDNNPSTFEVSKLTNLATLRYVFLSTSTNHWKVRVKDRAGNTNWSALYTLYIVSTNNLPPPVFISGITVDDGQHLVSLSDTSGYSGLLADNTGLKLSFALSGTVSSGSVVKIIYAWNAEPTVGVNEISVVWNGTSWDCEIPSSITLGHQSDTFYFQVIVDIYRIRNFDVSAINRSWGFKVRTLEAQAGEVTLLNNSIQKGNGQRTTAIIKLDSPKRLSIKVFSINGDKVIDIVDADYPAGTVTVSWDGKNVNGNDVGDGLYFLNIRIGDKTILKKIVVK